MSNAFVVLVSLYIGLVSGFIVPSGVTEHVTKKKSNVENVLGDLEIKSTTVATKFAVLPKSRNDIDENDLYEHATVKQNNQSERAFIYINQKYKKPIRNKIIMSLDKTEIIHRTFAPPTGTMAIRGTPCPISPFESSHTNSYFQAFDLADKQTQDIPSFFSSNSLFRCNVNDNGKKYKDNNKLKTQIQTPNKADTRRDYFELLKPPILRPVNRVNTKVNYEAIRKNDFPLLSPTMLPYKDNFIKKYSLNTPYLSVPKPAAERQDEMRKNYGFDRPYIHHPVFRNKDFLHKAEDVNFEGDFVNEDDSHRIFENNQEEDKLLDKYLKETLEEQITINDKTNINSNSDCSYRDCVLQSSPKQYTNNGLLVKPECKCGRRLNIKQSNPFIVKDRSLREETKRSNDTLSKSSEMSYFEEILTDDSNVNKVDNDVVRPPKKFNQTSSQIKPDHISSKTSSQYKSDLV